VRLEKHFTYNANATYLVFTPTGKSESGYQSSWCAWHSSTTDGNNKVAYSPYQADAGGSCGLNFVNSSNDSYGHGYFDGFSIVAGHEYEEAQTDPDVATGWFDVTGAEDADKCAWSPLSGNTPLANSQYYAVQPVWSNKAGGCGSGVGT
jgi:serine protease